MAFVMLLVAAIIIITAVQGTQYDLLTALETDVPPFVVWAAAVVAVGAIGYIPGMTKVSRWLLALVFVVIVLKNYQKAIDGFKALTGSSKQASTVPDTQSAGPASAYLANPSDPQITTAAAVGATGGNVNAAGTGTMTASAPNWLDPNTYLSAFRGIA